MRKHLLALVTLVTLSTTALAATHKIVINDVKGNFAETTVDGKAGFTATTDGIGITYYQAGGTTAPVAPTDLLKFYKSHVMIIDAGTETMNTIVFKCTSNYAKDITVDAGEAVTNADALTITWTGSVAKLNITASVAQVRITEIDVYTNGDQPQAEKSIENTAETAYSVAKAVELIEAGEGLSANVYVKGIISKVDSYNATYGSITYWISDDGTTTSQQFECYSGLNVGAQKFSSIDDLTVGAAVVVKGVMKKYTPKTGDPIYEFNYNNEIVSMSTGISNITADNGEDAAAFNAAGQRVNAQAKGIVIKGGKKFVNK